MTDTSNMGAAVNPWADKTNDEIMADLRAMIAACVAVDHPVLIMPARVHRFILFQMMRRALSRRAFRRWRGRWKAQRRAD